MHEVLETGKNDRVTAVKHISFSWGCGGNFGSVVTR